MALQPYPVGAFFLRPSEPIYPVIAFTHASPLLECGRMMERIN